jgi:hypothetical protein
MWSHALVSVYEDLNHWVDPLSLDSVYVSTRHHVEARETIQETVSEHVILKIKKLVTKTSTWRSLCNLSSSRPWTFSQNPSPGNPEKKRKRKYSPLTVRTDCLNSVCLFTLKTSKRKHLNLHTQGRTRPSVQTELDLHDTTDRWEERDKRKENVVFVPLKSPLFKRLLAIFFFYLGFTEVVCVHIHYWSVSGCVYSIVCRITFIQDTLFDVCVLLLFASVYIQTKLLQYYYREMVDIHVHLRDVQDLGVNNLGPLVSLLWVSKDISNVHWVSLNSFLRTCVVIHHFY